MKNNVKQIPVGPKNEYLRIENGAAFVQPQQHTQ